MGKCVFWKVNGHVSQLSTVPHENNQRYWIINVGCYCILWKDQLERNYETFIPMNNFKVDKDKISRSTFCFLHCVVGRGINKSGGMGGMSLKSWKQFTSPPKKCILSQGAMTKILYRLQIEKVQNHIFSFSQFPPSQHS